MAKAPPGISGTALLVVGLGGALAYAGIKGKNVGDLIRSWLSGDTGTSAPQASGIDNSSPSGSGVGGSLGSLVNGSGGIGAGISGAGGTPSANKAIGQSLASGFGWTGAQWQALDQLWTRESGWNNTAENPSSGAYGIPQALPATKLGAAGQSGDATAQIQWGLQYIQERYGNPVNAWTHELTYGWY